MLLSIKFARRTRVHSNAQIKQVNAFPTAQRRRYRTGRYLAFRVTRLMTSFVTSRRETLNGLMLYHAEEQVQLGRSPYLTKSETSLKVSVDRVKMLSNLWANLKETLFGELEKWEKARIRFTNNKGRPASVSIASVSGNILDDSYVRTVNIRDINPHLDNSSTHIVQHLADKMIEELFVHRGDKASPQMEPKRKAYA